MALCDHLETDSSLTKVNILSESWTTVYSHTTAMVPEGNYFCALTWQYQTSQDCGDDGVEFRIRANSSTVCQAVLYVGSTCEGGGSSDPANQITNWFRESIESDDQIEIEIQAKLESDSDPAWSSDFELIFYEDDDSKAHMAEYSEDAPGLGDDTETWQDVVQLDIEPPLPAGAYYNLWFRMDFADRLKVSNYIDIRVLYSEGGGTWNLFAPFGSQTYSTGIDADGSDDLKNCWAKSISCLFLEPDESLQRFKIQFRMAPDGGSFDVRINNAKIRALEMAI